MRIVVLLTIVIAVPLAVGLVTTSRRRGARPSPHDQPQSVSLEPEEFPDVGEPSPTRHGEPVPGSRADRQGHGKR